MALIRTTSNIKELLEGVELMRDDDSVCFIHEPGQFDTFNREGLRRLKESVNSYIEGKIKLEELDRRTAYYITKYNLGN